MKSPCASVNRARPLLGTLVAIRAPDVAGAGAAIAAAFSAIERVHGLMSSHATTGDVWRINHAEPGERVVVDPWTHEVLNRAKAVHRATGGLFDCTVATSSPDSTFDDLELDPDGAVRVQRPLAITLDGIAKGFAVDRAIERLQQAGLARGAVNAGGDLRLYGEEDEPLHVRHPHAPGRFVYLGSVRNSAVATSAGYFSVSPLIDPRTRREVRPHTSVTVIASDCMTADALTKPCRLSPARAAEYAGKFDCKVVSLQ
jgi:thiamine biosynthesis lipoprotein